MLPRTRCPFGVLVVSAWTATITLPGTALGAHAPKQSPDAPAPVLGELQPSGQTEWQRALFKNVSQRAAKLSREAVPALLEKLDSAAFRAHLAKCCPSAHGLSAEELLHRLQEQVRVTEVASGFPAVAAHMPGMPKGDIMPNGPGMSLADGLKGSFFQNVWQDVILHNRTFNVSKKVIWRAAFDPDGHSLHWEGWKTEGCHGRPLYKQTFQVNQCTTNPVGLDVFGQDIICRFVRNGTMASSECWFADNFKTTPKWHLSVKSPMDPTMVTCPTRVPELNGTYAVDGHCHSQIQVNFSTMWDLEDDAEMHSYGLKPFRAYGAPASLAEASERGPYTAVNTLLLDQGSPLFGDVAVIFSARRMRNIALISAVDTGSYQIKCTNTYSGPMPPNSSLPFNQLDCSAYAPFQQLGTFQDFNHLFLISDGFWNSTGTLARQVARLEGEWGSNAVPGEELLHYWEAMPAGSLRYPSDVRFVIGSFRGLFGTSSGADLQKWAKQRGWLLMWSLGLNLAETDITQIWKQLDANRTFQANQRLVDPEVAMHTSAAGALPLGVEALARFRSGWAKAAVLQRGTPTATNTTWAQHWWELADSLPAALRVGPLRPGACQRPPDAPECVGVSREGQCLCYSQVDAQTVVPRQQPSISVALVV